MSALLSVQGLSYRYPDGTSALREFSLEVQEGERLALMGPNGAGKSTLALHLNGLLQGGGRISVDGVELTQRSLRAVRQKVALVFQNPDDQLFCPTVFEDVAFGPRNLGLSEDLVAERVQSSLQAVGLSGFGGRNPAHLSIGEKKRAAIATVWALEPRLFVFDEPTSSLDARGRRSIMELLGGLGVSQIIVTHDLELVRSLCGRAVVMSQGRKVADAPVAEILDDRATLEAWGLI